MTVDGIVAAAPALPLSRKQLRSVVQSTSNVNMWTGAIRSGKTIASLLRWLCFVATAPYGGQLVMIGRTRESLARNVFAVLQDPLIFGELTKQVQYTPGAGWGWILGRKVWVFGASDVRAEMTLRGMTVAGAYGDEFTLWAEDLWTTLLGRMSVEGAQLFATTNPDNPRHWAKTKAVDRAAYLGWRHFHFLLDDNQWLIDNNPGYVARIKREYTGLYYRRFILGEWVQAEGAIYSQWDPEQHVIPAQAVPRLEDILATGVDYGTTNPSRAYLIGRGIRPDTGRPALYVVAEWAPPIGLTDAAQSGLYRAWLAALEPADWREPAWHFVDPAAASFRKQLFADGVLNVAPGHNAVLPGIRTVQSLLATGGLLVSDACTELVTQLPGYMWDPKATDKGLDAPLKVDDHEVDAVRYGIHSSRAMWRDAVPVSVALPGAPGADELPDRA